MNRVIYVIHSYSQTACPYLSQDKTMTGMEIASPTPYKTVYGQNLYSEKVNLLTWVSTPLFCDN